jgi:hypothetical protein
MTEHPAAPTKSDRIAEIAEEFRHDAAVSGTDIALANIDAALERAERAARSTPAEALDPHRLSEAGGNVLDGRRIGSVRLYRNTITPDDWEAIAAEYLRLLPHNREADHE